ncbi:MAG: polysaccharide biosynthesis protein [Yoonia sp.]|uniref:polysaccharide biosynthesis protein n=1 Tax=Yoonia sp. TaxID=2212373 RepID=UPI003EF1CF15
MYTKIAELAITLTRRQKYIFLLLVDFLLVPLSFGLSKWIWADTLSRPDVNLFGLLAVMAIAGMASSVMFGLPRIKLNSYEQIGMRRTAGYSAIVGFAGVLCLEIFYNNGPSAQFMLFVTMVLMILSVSARLLIRNILLSFYHRGHTRQRVLIYGAGQTGVQLAAALKTDDAVQPVAFIDDNPTLQKVLVLGLPVYPPSRTQTIIAELKVDRVVLAMPSISSPKQARLARHLEAVGCEVSTLPSFASLIGEGELIDRMQPANPSSYLGRVKLDKELAGGCGLYRDGCIMITGAGGSIGAELCRQVIKCRPKKLVLFEVSEPALYQIDRELADVIENANETGRFDCEIIPVLGSVTDEAQVLRAMKNNAVDTVLHAAAYKHVTMVEKNRLSGLYNNVIGTRTAALAAREAGVRNFILVSTDKAVHPENVMGASKRMGELLVQDVATRSETTRYGIVRFGNVLGSSGSVVPLFEEQIARGGPITLSHTEVTRYFMTISEAARLVLLVGSQAHQQNEQGEVYVLDMGAPVPIKRLARQMIETAGYTVCDSDNPDGDIEITITGLRPGEKLHEELAMRGHRVSATAHAKILRVEETALSELEMAAAIRALTDAIDAGDDDAALGVLHRWVGASTTRIKLPTAHIQKLDGDERPKLLN